MQEVFVNSKNGQIHISSEVLAVISGTAALEVDGVISSLSSGNMSSRVAKRNFARGVKISFDEEGKIKVGMNIAVKSGHKLHEVANQVQERVSTALETMAGYKVSGVNVNVSSMHFEKPAQPQKRR